MSFLQIVFSQQCMVVDATTTSGENNVLITCDDLDDNNDICIDLQVSFTPVNSTEVMDVESIAFNPIIPFDQGTPLVPTLPLIDGIVDDKFSDAIPLGFSFCFYDSHFSEIVIGTNGILTFDLNEANADAPSGVSVQNPNPALIDNAIFAIQHDLLFDIDDTSEIYYSTIGEEHCRKFVVNYYDAIIFGCDGRSTIQVVLHEFTNEIEVHILEKPPHCENGRNPNSLLGIMNSDGTIGVSPPNRNTGIWDAQQESYRFFPIGNQAPDIIWYDDSENIVGTGEQIQVCSNQSTIYTAEVRYNSCSGNLLFGTDSVNVEYAAEVPVVSEDSFYICDENNDGQTEIILSEYNNQITPQNTNLFTFTYYESLEDANNQRDEITSIITNVDLTIYVRIANSSNPNCYVIHPISFSFTAAEIGDMTITLCDNENDNIEHDVNLIPHIESFLQDVDFEFYSIHLNEQDAVNQSNEITSSNITSSSTFWLHVGISEYCAQIVGPIHIEFLNSPPDRTADTIVFEACDINFNHMEPFDWLTEIPLVIDLNPGETFTVHTSLSDARNRRRNQTQISDNFNPYFVRIQNSNGCFNIVEVPVEVEFYGVDATAMSIDICFDGTEDITVNLDDYPLQMLVDPLEGVDIFLYGTNEDAEQHNLENIINPIQTITEDGYHVLTTFYVRFQISDDCYTVRQIRIRMVHPVPMMNPIDVCDIFNDGNEENNLRIYDPYILGEQVGTVTYFLNQNDADNDVNALTTYNFTEDVTLFVRIQSYGCVEIYPIDFQLTSVLPLENLDLYVGEVCDNNNDGIITMNLSIFAEDVYEGTDNVTIEYYLNYNPLTQSFSNQILTPEFHPVEGSFTFYIKVSEENSICFSVASISLTIDLTDTFEISPADLYACDFQFDLNEEFDLRDAIPQLTENYPDYDESLYSLDFFQDMEDLENNTDPIGPIFTPNSASYPVYVRFTNRISGCTAINILTLHTVGAPKPVASTTAVCDNNLNGMYDLDLNILGGLVMEGITDGFIFTYHLTKEDAEEEIRMLDASEIYEVEPFPERIWVRVENALIDDCFDVSYVIITFNELTHIDEHTLYQFSCDIDNDGFSNFDLTFVEEIYPTSQYSLSYYESLEQINNYEDPISNPSDYVNIRQHNQEIFLVIQSVDACPIYAIIDLEVIPTPRILLNPALFCPGFTTDVIPEVLDPNAEYSYEWVNSQGEIISTEFILTDIGVEEVFTLWVTDINFPECRTAFDVEVVAYVPPVILDIVEDGNTITVIATGHYPIEYSMDGINWQGLNYFTNLPVGPHTFWVRYITEGCVSDPKRGLILNIHNVITPNGDGYNDYIAVNDLDVFEGKFSTFEIYDRYGKVIFKESSNTRIVWDGKYLGRVLNSTDYWYILTLPDGRKYRGSITVKNF